MNRIISVLLLMSCFWFSGCEINNLEDLPDVPKSDFNEFNYILATEDASNVDLTTFFAFSLNKVNPNTSYDLKLEDGLFVNSDPSVSSGQLSFGRYFFSLAKDKSGYSSTPGLYRMTLNEDNRVYIDKEINISRDNLFPARQLCIVNDHLGYFYNEGKQAQSIQIFDPTSMTVKGSIDLKPAIQAFRPDAKWVDEAGNNLVRTGSLVLEAVENKLLVSVVFLETASFNLISDKEQNFYLAVIDRSTNKVDKIISYEGAKTVGFFVSENKATAVDDLGNVYFDSWGWNQFNQPNPSKIFRMKSGADDFDKDWVIDVESLFGKGKIAQSIAVFNGKIYLHISDAAYGFDAEDDPGKISMSYYEFDPNQPGSPKKLAIPSSNTSSRMSVFSTVGDKLFIAVPNVEGGKFNGVYSIDKSDNLKKELTIDHKYRPTRVYRLGVI